MGWLSKIFSSTGSNVISSVGKVIDDLITSDEEVALTEIQVKKIKAAYNVRMQELMIELDKQAANHELNMEGELTERLKLDMKSDSWLSKNIRPLSLVFMTVVVSILAFFTIFDQQFTPTQLDTMKQWVPLFQTLMLTIYGFYFGSRGLEKIQKIRASKQTKGLAASLISPFEQEPRG